MGPHALQYAHTKRPLVAAPGQPVQAARTSRLGQHQRKAACSQGGARTRDAWARKPAARPARTLARAQRSARTPRAPARLTVPTAPGSRGEAFARA
ncbi:hypothetical protein PR202_ga17639 [Eleusine coracana subsp. coracana]|uniref:Uncharacterized protein n=1 Tax=Eleusine coracana subsp. coracana TaxID=191504 RepID=A0AAV5CNT4_ELECO|nr:hypothetical protein PR202_ga17392 [Eleusine coracana subsp. coracana]GJN00456.1 hypothetical protein PR202_ga17639 [Eleusine coracana subsp. coracana]